MISQHPARPTANINSMPSILLLVGLVVSQQEKTASTHHDLVHGPIHSQDALGMSWMNVEKQVSVNGIIKHVVKYVT